MSQPHPIQALRFHHDGPHTPNILLTHCMMFWLSPTAICSLLVVPDITGSLPHPVQALHVHHDGPLLPHHPIQALCAILVVLLLTVLGWPSQTLNRCQPYPLQSPGNPCPPWAWRPTPPNQTLHALHEILVVPNITKVSTPPSPLFLFIFDYLSSSPIPQ